MNFFKNKNIEIFIICLILVNIVSFSLQTDQYFNQKYSIVFDLIETFSVVIFTVEYLIRISLLKKIKEAFKPLIMFDLLAIIPFYLSFLPDSLLLLRILRFFRIFRILKISRYSKALHNIANVFARKKEELIITLAFFFIAVMVSATLMYYAEANSQEAFSSIPNSLWWAIITFTTIGYGDVYPVTAIGKILASFISVIGVGIHGLLIGVIGSGFMDEFFQKK